MPLNTFLFEANLSGERIFKILKQSIINMKMLIALQEFKMEHWEALKKTMSPIDYITVMGICKKYFANENLTTPIEEISIDESTTTYINEPEIDFEISLLIKLLSKRKATSQYCLSIPISQSATTFLFFMEKLQSYMREHINKSAETETKRAHHLKQLYEQNIALYDQLSNLRSKASILESQKKKIQTAKEKDLTRHQNEIEDIRSKFKARVEDKILESERQMITDWKNSEFRQVTLIEEVATQQALFDNLMKEKLAKEKELRVKRYKVESQLVAVLEKYDMDIGDRHRQKEELTAQLEEEKLELEQLQERFDEQEITYNELMTEKELHDKRIFDEKLYRIRSKMAARKIQKRWRKYLERKAKSKKRGKGKGKGRK